MADGSADKMRADTLALMAQIETMLTIVRNVFTTIATGGVQLDAAQARQYAQLFEAMRRAAHAARDLQEASVTLDQAPLAPMPPGVM
jgi:hypothetical protein